MAYSGRSLLPSRPSRSETNVMTDSSKAMLLRLLQSAPARRGGRATPTMSPTIENVSRSAETPARSSLPWATSGKSDVQFMTTTVQQKSNSNTTIRK